MKALSKISLGIVMLVLLPCFASAQAVNTSASAQQTLLSQLQALQQELASLEATIGALINAATSGGSIPVTGMTGIPASTMTPPLSPRIFAPDITTASVVPFGIDPAFELQQLITAPIATSTFTLPTTGPTTYTSVAPAVQGTSSVTPTYDATVHTACQTPGATLVVTGGFQCGAICMAVPGSILSCINGTWQLPLTL